MRPERQDGATTRMGRAGTPHVLVATPVPGPLCEHGEGAVWDVAAGVLHYLDVDRGDVLTHDPRTGTTTRQHVGERVAAMRPRTRGGWVLALTDGFACTEAGSWTLDQPIPIPGEGGSRLNDGGCDSAGNFVCGSMVDGRTAGGAKLYRLTPAGSVEIVLQGVTVSNGFCLDAAGRLAYYVDTPTGVVDVFDVGPDGATLSRRRPFAILEPGAGLPDGLTVDAEGGVWVAVWDGHSVRRYSPDGQLDLIVEVPTPLVTSCAFGGEALQDLYITTSRQGRLGGQDGFAGQLYRVRVKVRGLPPRPYAG